MDIKVEKKEKAINKNVTYAIAVFAFLVVVYFLSGKWNGSTLKVERVRLQVSEVKKDMFNEFVPLRATVMPFDSVFLDAVQRGSVIEAYVEEGANVVKGQKLAKLSNTQLQLDVISREAQVSEQLNDLRNTRLAMERQLLELKERGLELDFELSQAKRKFDNSKILFKSGALPDDQFLNIKESHEYFLKKTKLVKESLAAQQKLRSDQLVQLESNTTNLMENLEIAKLNLESLTIKSSIDGQLTSFELKPGQSVDVGERVGQVDDITNYKLEAWVDEFYINLVAIGKKAYLEGVGEGHYAEVQKISPEVVNGQFEVELNFVGEMPKGIRRGQTVRFRLVLDSPSEALVLENGSYFQETGGRKLFVLDESGDFASLRDVKVGRSNPDFIEIISGVNAGERVITSSYRGYMDYTKIVF